jgi:predicted nucleotidyltransferase
MSQLLEISKGLLTPVILIITTYIAFQQWKTNKQKLDLDKYDRRLKIYEEVIKLLQKTSITEVSLNELVIFRAAVAEADFLFGPDILEYIEEICSHWKDLWVLQQENRDRTQEIREHTLWLANQIVKGNAKEKFKKYMYLGK